MEYFWKASHQIVMLTPDRPSNEADIEGWGSGFILEYKGRQFFITCDHNLHMLDDFANGERSGEDFLIAIIANYKDPQTPLSTGFVTIPGFYYFDSIDLNTPEIMDLKDIAFAELKTAMPLPLLTNQLNHYDGSVAVKAGELKLFIQEETISEAKVGKDYVITGCICNRIVDGIRMERRTTFREGIKYTGRSHMGSFMVFENPDIINVEEWEGLSGSPIFDEEGKLVGMVNEVVDGSREIYVTPINHILRFIDYAIKSENVNEQMKKPLVSIVVPVYKVPEQYLRQCIESCINQTMREIEIILVDDGSPDDCGKICDEYAEKDARVRVIHKENGGLVSARNAGFDAIQGEWHMYIDGDDWIDLDTCESIFKVLNKYKDIDVVFWKCIQELGDKSIKGKWEWPCLDDEHVYSGDECSELARNVLVYKSGIATAYCKLIRTEYAKKNGIRHDDRLKQGMEGTEFSLRTFYYAKHVLYINAYWNHYLFNPMSISKLGSEYNAKCITDCVKVMEEDIASFRNKDVFEQTLYQRVVYALIATGLSTYFHPSSKKNLWSRTRKYAKYIKDYPFYTKSIQKCSTEGMDKQRRVVLLLLRFKLYFLLQIVSNVKAYYLKKGKFDY